MKIELGSSKASLIKSIVVWRPQYLWIRFDFSHPMLGVAVILGAPIFILLGGTALILFWGSGQPAAMVAIDYYRLTIDPTLPAIPLFALTGYFLAEGGAAGRLTRFFSAHIWMLPAALLGLVGVHMYLVIRLGISHVPAADE